MTETMYVVIPCYNEEQMLPITAKALIKKLDELKAEGRIAQNSKVMFVDDGSKDKTWEINHYRKTDDTSLWRLMSSAEMKYYKFCRKKLATLFIRWLRVFPPKILWLRLV